MEIEMDKETIEYLSKKLAKEFAKTASKFSIKYLKKYSPEENLSTVATSISIFTASFINFSIYTNDMNIKLDFLKHHFEITEDVLKQMIKNNFKPINVN